MSTFYLRGITKTNIKQDTIDVDTILQAYGKCLQDDDYVSAFEKFFSSAEQSMPVDMFADTIAQFSQNNAKDDTRTDLIEKSYTSNRLWKQNTNLKCWYCTLNFTNKPVPLPIGLEAVHANDEDFHNKEEQKYFTQGNFCSFSCVASYIHDSNMTLCEKQNHFALLNNLYYKFVGIKLIGKFNKSPPKTEMQSYGGYMTEADYTQKIKTLNMY